MGPGHPLPAGQDGAMPRRIPPLLRPQIGFAHRGARAHERENTLEAFELALRLGATGLETDAWLTRDGEVVLDHDGVIRRLLGRRPIRELDRRDLPGHIPTLHGNLWLCGGDLDQVASWRALDSAVRLVDSTRLKRVREGPERRAARLVELGIDAINLHHSDWTGGLATLFHRFGRYAFAWDLQHERQLHAALDMGLDAIYSDWSDRLAASLAAFTDR
jgi:glycerophosphoryl diester phosphodiesterase